MIRRLMPPRFISVMTAFATKGATAAMLFLQSVVLSRFLGVEAMGVYFFAMAIYRIGESAAPFGIPMSAVREVGAAHATQSWQTIRSVAKQATFILSHAFVLVDGSESAEPLFQLSSGQMTIGRAAVAAFFVVSGLLISMSFDRSKSLPRFVSNRALRLFPGLWVCIFLLVFVAGPLLTTLPVLDYVQSRDTLGFMGSILFFPLSQSIAGVFDGSPGSDAINGSLWTLKYEVACYVLGAFLMSTGRHRVIIVTLFWLAAMVAAPLIGDPLEQRGGTYYLAWMVWLFRFYGAGMLLYLWRDHIPLSKGTALACLPVVIGGIPLSPRAERRWRLSLRGLPHILLAPLWGRGPPQRNLHRICQGHCGRRQLLASGEQARRAQLANTNG